MNIDQQRSETTSGSTGGKSDWFSTLAVVLAGVAVVAAFVAIAWAASDDGGSSGVEAGGPTPVKAALTDYKITFTPVSVPAGPSRSRSRTTRRSTTTSAATASPAPAT